MTTPRLGPMSVPRPAVAFDSAALRPRLRATRDRLRAMAETTDLVLAVDADMTVRFASPSVERLLGYRPEELWDRPLLDIVDPAQFARLRQQWAGLLAEGPDAPPAPARETRFRHHDGSWRVLEALARPAQAASGAPEVVVNARDVADLRRAEERQQDTEQRYQALFDLNPLPMWVHDRSTLRFLAVNDAALQSYGYTREEFLAMTVTDLRSRSESGTLEESVPFGSTGSKVSGVWLHRKKNGTLIDVALRSADFEFGGWPARLVLAEDVTARARAEEQLRHAQKMDALGRLAGGVAHDFNNLLFVIVGYAEQVLRKLPSGHPDRARLDGIVAAGHRAAALTRQLLTFSRRETAQPRVVDLNQVVSQMEGLVRRLVGGNIEVVTALWPAPGRTVIDTSHLEQVLMNFVVNARDAMPSGGRLRIETSNVRVDETVLAAALDVSPGEYVMLSVTDTGHGMDPEVRDRAFEPFFTTKEKGSGTGLGLSIVYGIVKQAGGRVSVYSEPGHGTTFNVYLPRVDEDPAAISEPAAAPPRGTETVLLVEDEDAVREITRDNLADFGYTVLEARDAREARAVAAARAGGIDLLVTDMFLGRGGSGRDVAAEVARLTPGLPVVVLSGYAGAAEGEASFPPRTRFLAKPVTLDALLRTVRAALDGGETSPLG